MKKKETTLHRGRIQAQGKSLEESESWAKDTFLTLDEGKILIEKLKNKLTKTALKIRRKAFDDLEKYVEKQSETGIFAPHLGKAGRFRVKGTKSERVELEVWEGIAFKKD